MQIFCAIDVLSQRVQRGKVCARAWLGSRGGRQASGSRVARMKGYRMNFNFRHSLALTAVVCAGLSVATAADAKTFKWANSGEVGWMDADARHEIFLLTLYSHICEPLIRRDRNLKLELALATKWGQTNSTAWFFDIRPGVKFHDGTPFTADDVVLDRKSTRLNSSHSQISYA